MNCKKKFIDKYSQPAKEVSFEKVEMRLESMRFRRSCRVWSENQMSELELHEFALKLVQAAIYAPNSGNRQAWRFAILIDPDEKRMLKGLKEKHCYTAPLLIFVGMDSRFYRAAGHLNNCLYLDAGAAISNMIHLAHECGLGTCWNHLGEELINSRKLNVEIYQKFCKQKNIPNYIKPAGILAIGRPEFIPPMPERLGLKEYILD